MLQVDNIYFVLIRPTFLGNIGSTARVLKNFGFKNLRLVDPPRNYKDAEARKMSLGAFDLLKSAQCFDTLAAALKDINIAVGTTSAHQRVCKTQSITDVCASLQNDRINRVAVILGEERDGMKTEDFERCQFIATIPCNPEFPSLNLAHAAGIFAYELTRPSKSPGSIAELELSPSGADTDEFFKQLDQTLHDRGFTKSFNRNSIMSELRVLFNKANPSARELQLLNAILKSSAR